MRWNELFYTLGVNVMPPLTILASGLASRQLALAMKGDLNHDSAKWPFIAQTVFTLVHLIGAYWLWRRR